MRDLLECGFLRRTIANTHGALFYLFCNDVMYTDWRGVGGNGTILG